MKSKIYNGMIVLNKKNINEILFNFTYFSDVGIDFVAGMIGMLECFGLTVYMKGDEWIMEDRDRNELGRKTIDNLENI